MATFSTVLVMFLAFSAKVVVLVTLLAHLIFNTPQKVASSMHPYSLLWNIFNPKRCKKMFDQFQVFGGNTYYENFENSSKLIKNFKILTFREPKNSQYFLHLFDSKYLIVAQHQSACIRAAVTAARCL